MRIEEIDNCLIEAERFVKAAIKAKRAIETMHKENSEWYSEASKDVASCKRASLDLTRALSEIRKP